MSEEGKTISAAFFATAQGNEPVRTWLKEELTLEQRKAVGTDVKAVEFGWPMGMPKVRKLEPELWEVRTRFKDGIARVLFSVVDDKMVLLHGFFKTRQKTREEDLETARKRLRVYKEQKGAQQ